LKGSQFEAADFLNTFDLKSPLDDDGGEAQHLRIIVTGTWTKRRNTESHGLELTVMEQRRGARDIDCGAWFLERHKELL
jgi:hypothetical protein